MPVCKRGHKAPRKSPTRPAVARRFQTCPSARPPVRRRKTGPSASEVSPHEAPARSPAPRQGMRHPSPRGRWSGSPSSGRPASRPSQGRTCCGCQLLRGTVPREKCAPPGRTRRAGGAGSRQQKRSAPAPDDPPRRRRPKPGRACRGPGESPSFTPDAGPSARPRTGCPRSSRVVRPAGAGACRPCAAVRRSGARRPARGRRRCPCAW